MRCSCKACGTYMVQRERGLLSGCCCPNCGNICRDCMGSISGPLDVEALRARFQEAQGEEHTTGFPETEENPAQEGQPGDWRRYL